MRQHKQPAREITTAVAATAAAVLLGALLMSLARGVVPTASDIERFTCDGNTVAFTFHFGVWNTSEVRATAVDANGTPDVLTLASEYSVTLPNGDGWLTPGGTVTTVETYASGYTLVVDRLPPLDQQTDYSTLEDLDLETLEDDMDKRAVIERYLWRTIQRCVRIPAWSNADANLTPIPSRYLVIDANGNLSLSSDSGAIDPNVEIYADGVTGYMETLIITIEDLNDLVAALGEGVADLADGELSKSRVEDSDLWDAAYEAIVALDPNVAESIDPNITQMTDEDPNDAGAGGAGFLWWWDPDPNSWRLTTLGVLGKTLLAAEDDDTVLDALGLQDFNGIDLLDEDDLASDSDAAVPTQQSVKAYIDAAIEANLPSCYTSDWTAAASHTNYTFTHGLGASPDIIQLWYSDTADGSGDVVLVGVPDTGDSVHYNSAIIDVNDTEIVVRVSICLVRYRDAEGDYQGPSTGWLKCTAVKF